MTQPTEYVLGFCAGTSAVVYVYRQVSAIVAERKHKPNGSASAGFQNASAELRRFQNREDLREIMESYMKTQTDALVSIKDSLGRLTIIAERHWK